MKEYKSVLLLKVPTFRYPDGVSEHEDIRVKYKAPWDRIPSLALAVLSAFFHQYNRFGYGLKAVDINFEGFASGEVDQSAYPKILEDCIRTYEYDVLAISVAYVYNVRWVDLTVRLSRKYHPEAKIMIGGCYPTLFPERSLEDHDIDDAVIGEGESTFLHILNRYNGYRDEAFEEKFPFSGYASKNDKGEIVVVPRQGFYLKGEDIPPAQWHHLNIDKYLHNASPMYVTDASLKILPVESSRGCPYNCSFCSTSFWWGKNVRYKPVDRFLDEIAEAKNRYGIEEIYFVDDNATFSKTWIKEFLIKFMESDINLKLDFQNFSLKHLDEEITDLLIRAGIREITIAVETGSRAMQKLTNKNLDFNKVREVVRMIKTKKVALNICWIIGFPNETIEQINETVAFARELKAHYNEISIFTPLPGTKLFDLAVSQGLLKFDKDDLSLFDFIRSDCIKSEHWDYEQLRQIYFDTIIELNYLNSPYLDTDDGIAHLMEISDPVMNATPDHVICHIVLGYVHKLGKNEAESRKIYGKAAELLKNEESDRIFSKYLSWDHPIIRDFNHFLADRK